MAEPTKQQIGDGSDNYGQAAKQAANAAKQVGKNTAKQAAAKGVEETAKAAAATVKAGVKTGKAVSGIAAGTAAGGPWGAIIAAAWSMRHTLFKVLIAISLVIVFIIVIIVSLPQIIFDKIFGSDDPQQPVNPQAIYQKLEYGVSITIDDGYTKALEEVERIIKEGKYDRKLSMDALVDNAKNAMEFDTCYVLAAYSISMEQKNTTQADMMKKLKKASGTMFPVTYEAKEETVKDNEGNDTTEIRRYVVCTIHPMKGSVFLDAFGVNAQSEYGDSGMTNGEAIDYMANILKMTLFGKPEE